MVGEKGREGEGGKREKGGERKEERDRGRERSVGTHQELVMRKVGHDEDNMIIVSYTSVQGNDIVSPPTSEKQNRHIHTYIRRLLEAVATILQPM